MPVTIDGTSGITTPTYNGADTSEYLVPVTAFKNRIINGAMGIWQRGTSGFTTNGAYTSDRWYIAGASLNCSQSTDVPAGFKYSLSLTGTAGSFVAQKIESLNCSDLVGQNITISFWLKQTTGAGTGAVNVVIAYPSALDNWTTPNYVGVSSINTTTSWAQYSVTVSNLSSLYANGLAVVIQSAGSGTPVFLVTGIQLEKGATATSFDVRPYGTELQLCQRYYQQFGGSTFTNWGSGQISGSGGSSATLQFLVTMRTSPALTVVGTGFTAQDNSLGPVTATISGSAYSPFNVALTYTHAALTNNASRRLLFSDNASFLQFSSEL